LEIDNVVLHTVPMGGSFGRKRYNDFVIETAWIAQVYFQRKFRDQLIEKKNHKVKVQLVWTREDDLAREHYRPASVQRLDWNGQQRNQIQHTLCESGAPAHTMSVAAGAQFDFLDWNIPSTGKVVAGDFLPAIWRGVAHGYFSFAICSFMDELSYCHDEDPIAFFSRHIRQLSVVERLKLSINAGTRYQPDRLLKVVENVKRASNWKLVQRQNKAMGFAAYPCFGSYIAIVVDITLKEGILSVSEAWAAVDCGIAVNPNGIRAQIEGGIMYGLSACLSSEISNNPDNASPNFDSYIVARMQDAPIIHVSIEESQRHPTGVGELGVAAIGPAVANAVRRATNMRFVSFPLLKQSRLNLENAIQVNELV
ncbi:MAG: xanthine dehydrogenase family protein molybdopterin-binding subunit, partial [Pseudomonadales bacterium]|nr:xanthine dehydrogenase family protein molybdopterin-binding subunit [Pseudomonadales bacterium]